MGLLPAELQTRVRASLERVNDTPYSTEEIEKALEDFIRFSRFTMDQANQTPSLKVVHPDDGDETEDALLPLALPFHSSTFGANTFCLGSGNASHEGVAR